MSGINAIEVLQKINIKQNVGFLQQFVAFRYFHIVRVSEIKHKKCVKEYMPPCK